MRNGLRNTVAMTLFIAAVMFVMASCEHKPVMAHGRFVHLPASGWRQAAPLTFEPEYDDSTLVYDISLAVRHNNSYRYRNLSLAVDVISQDSTVNRQYLEIPLADAYGNWTGGGFGTLYQKDVAIVSRVMPRDARSVVVWQTMRDCETLHGLVDLGVTVFPN